MTEATQSGDVRIIQGTVRLFRKQRRLFFVLIFLSLISILLLTGIYTVPMNETAALFLFGKLVKDDIPPGIHFRLPKPIHRVELMNTTEIRSMRLTREYSGAVSMITGDENIISIDVAVQYKIIDYEKFLIGCEDWIKVLNQTTSSCLTELLAAMEVDEVLTTGKNWIQSRLQEILQDRMRKYNSGITVFSVTMANVKPPKECADSFLMVSNARNEKSEKINIAHSNRNRLLSGSRGEAVWLFRQAESWAEEMVKKAEGDGARYRALLGEYNQTKEIIRQDLYLQAMEKVISRADIFLFNPEHTESLDLNLFLPNPDSTRRINGDNSGSNISAVGNLQNQTPPASVAPRNLSDTGGLMRSQEGEDKEDTAWENIERIQLTEKEIPRRHTLRGR